VIAGGSAYRVFVSHSMRPDDLKIVYDAAQQLQTTGIHCYFAERDVRPGGPLPAKIAEAIEDSNSVVAFLTEGGTASAFVNQEVGLALGRLKPIVPVVEKGLLAPGFLAGVEFIELDRSDPQPAIQRLTAYLSAQHSRHLEMRAMEAERALSAAQQRASTAEAVAVAALLALIIIGLLALASSSKS
jgi:hypothetical protein